MKTPSHFALIALATASCTASGSIVANLGSEAPTSSPGAPPVTPTTAPASEPVAPTTVVEVPSAAPQPEPVSPPVLASGAPGAWPAFHGDLARSGRSSAPAIKKPRVRWSARVGIQSWLDSPLVTGQLVLVPSSGAAHDKPDAEDGLVALDLASGKRVWFFHTDQDANGAVVQGDRAYVGSDDGNVYAVTLASGKLIWKQTLKGKVWAHPVPLGQLVIVADGFGYVRGLAATDGAEKWSTQLTGGVRSGTATDGKLVYVVSQGGDAAAIAPDGKVRWKRRVSRPAWDHKGPDVPIEGYAAPVISDRNLIVPFARDTYYEDEPAFVALDLASGRDVWRAKGAGQWGNVRSTPARSGGQLVYSEPYSGDVVGLAEASGRVSWRVTVGPCYFPQYASPAAAEGVVYVPRFDGALYAVEGASGRTLWSYYLGDSKQLGGRVAPTSGCEWTLPGGYPLYSPTAIASDGTILQGSEEGLLYALGES